MPLSVAAGGKGSRELIFLLAKSEGRAHALQSPCALLSLVEMPLSLAEAADSMSDYEERS